MRALLQRVSSGSVYIAETGYTAAIGPGLVVLLGVKTTDSEPDSVYMAEKTCSLRIFSDENDKMNRSIKETNGEILIISQFTLYGDGSKGNRPGYTDSARPELAIPLYEKYIFHVKNIIGADKVKTGVFGAMMSVHIQNEGPVTLLLESKNT